MAARSRIGMAHWEGGLKEGRGQVRTGSGALESGYGFDGRFGEGEGTNPEELIGAAAASCLAMAVSSALGKKGHTPDFIDVRAEVALGEQKGDPAITTVDLSVRAHVPGMNHEELERITKEASEHCPVARALAATDVRLTSVESVQG